MFSISSRFLSSYLNAMDEYGNAALIGASCKGYLEAVRALLNEDRVHVNVKEEYDNRALIGASLTGHSEVSRASGYTHYE